MFLTFETVARATAAYEALNRHRHSNSHRIVTLEFVEAPIDDDLDGASVDHISHHTRAGSLGHLESPPPPRVHHERGESRGSTHSRRSTGSPTVPNIDKMRSFGTDVTGSSTGVDDDCSSDGYFTASSLGGGAGAGSGAASGNGTGARGSAAGSTAHYEYLMRKQVSQWSTEEVCLWLVNFFDFGIYGKQYGHRMREATVTGLDLQQLDPADLNELLVMLKVLPHHRKRIVHALHTSHRGYMRWPGVISAGAPQQHKPGAPGAAPGTTPPPAPTSPTPAPMRRLASTGSMQATQATRSGAAAPRPPPLPRSLSTGSALGVSPGQVDLASLPKSARKNARRRAKKRLEAESRGLSRLAKHVSMGSLTGAPLVPPPVEGHRRSTSSSTAVRFLATGAVC